MTIKKNFRKGIKSNKGELSLPDINQINIKFQVSKQYHIDTLKMTDQ